MASWLAMNYPLQDRYPFSPFPSGWYWIEFSENLPKGKLIGKQWMGEEIVAWRDDSDQVCVANAICPHLGAKLSPQHGGKLREGNLVCPFHGFTYDASGVCVATQHGPPKHKVSLHRYPVIEKHGVVMAYWDLAGEEPDWEVPELSQEGWSSWVYDSAKIRTHPQEPSENGVDVDHLAVVHSYFDVSGGQTLKIDGPFLENSFCISRKIRFFGPMHFTANIEATVSIFGLGCSLISTRIEDLDLSIRQLAMCAPIDGEYLEFVMSLQMTHANTPNKVFPGLGLLPKEFFRSFARKVFFEIYKNDISQDFEIWSSKKYLEYPRLIEEDGPILEYRRYCQQFYADDQLSKPAVPQEADNGSRVVRIKDIPAQRIDETRQSSS